MWRLSLFPIQTDPAGMATCQFALHSLPFSVPSCAHHHMRLDSLVPFNAWALLFQLTDTPSRKKESGENGHEPFFLLLKGSLCCTSSYSSGISCYSLRTAIRSKSWGWSVFMGVTTHCQSKQAQDIFYKRVQRVKIRRCRAGATLLRWQNLPFCCVLVWD